MENRITGIRPEQRILEQLQSVLHGLMDIESIKIISQGEKPDVEFAGKIWDLEENGTFDQLIAEFEALGYTPLLTEQEGTHILRAAPVVADKRTGNPWVNIGLFLATLLSVILIGSQNEGGQPFRNPADFALGLPFAGTLLGILTVHELSHYFVGRKYGSPLSLPYFIPVPMASLSILGTMGAVIFQRSPMRSRRALFDIGIAGPIGGLIVAIPLLIIGLSLSTVEPLPVGAPYIMEGNSLLYFLAKWLVFGQPLPANGIDVMLHPVAFAAWAGLMVTGLNLFPVGQLDGGHVTYALWGRKAWRIARIFVTAMFIWGGIATLLLGNSGWVWLMWGLLGLTMNPRHPAPLDDVTPIDPVRRTVGWVMAVIFVLIVVPIPLTFILPS
ncbi:MAG: site-2 protease family protein [Anaerolineae bacterium]|nr:site-2 protease family protein [Anaerolineae bacterium]